MAVVVKIPTQLRAVTDGEAEAEVAGGTVGEVLDSLFDRFAELRDRICDDGDLRRFVNVYVGGEDIRFLSGLETEVSDGDEVTILPAGQALGVAAQHGLDEFLVAAVRQLGCAPGSGKRRDHLLRFARGRELEARQLVFREAREVGYVGRKIGRHAERTDLVGESQPPVELHGARLGRVRLRVERRARLLIDEHDADAAAAEFVGEHQAAGAAPDDDDLGLCRNGVRTGCRPRRTIRVRSAIGHSVGTS